MIDLSRFNYWRWIGARKDSLKKHFRFWCGTLIWSHVNGVDFISQLVIHRKQRSTRTTISLLWQILITLSICWYINCFVWSVNIFVSAPTHIYTIARIWWSNLHLIWICMRSFNIQFLFSSFSISCKQLGVVSVLFFLLHQCIHTVCATQYASK